ncbi:hypothetical protein DK254_03105 [Pseudomonas sp. RW407]|nr:hypothetical protein DK254_03105 [Pseudomonas sp. RW407]
MLQHIGDLRLYLLGLEQEAAANLGVEAHRHQRGEVTKHSPDVRMDVLPVEQCQIQGMGMAVAPAGQHLGIDAEQQYRGSDPRLSCPLA